MFGRPARRGDVALDAGRPRRPAADRACALNPARSRDCGRAARRRSGSGRSPARRHRVPARAARGAGPHGAINEITVTPAQRHVLSTDLTLVRAAVRDSDRRRPRRRSPLHARQRVTHFVNGLEYFDDLFQRLHEAQHAERPVRHLAGWAMFPRRESPQAPDRRPRRRCRSRSRRRPSGSARRRARSRFLAARFIQLEPGSTRSAPPRSWPFTCSSSACSRSTRLGVSFVRTDAGGRRDPGRPVLRQLVLVQRLFATGGAASSRTRTRSTCSTRSPTRRAAFSPFPATVADNTAVAAAGVRLPLRHALQDRPALRHLPPEVRASCGPATAHFGYCGGIDLNPNRLDDDDHLARGPYHDVTAKVEGPAVRDLAITFKQRWDRDGAGDALRLPDLPTRPPRHAGQRHRPGRAHLLPAAGPARGRCRSRPHGDRTIADTMLAAIRQATRVHLHRGPVLHAAAGLSGRARREGRAAARSASSSSRCRSGTDQPFGEMVRDEFVTALRTADAGRGIVQRRLPAAAVHGLRQRAARVVGQVPSWRAAAGHSGARSDGACWRRRRACPRPAVLARGRGRADVGLRRGAGSAGRIEAA